MKRGKSIKVKVFGKNIPEGKSVSRPILKTKKSNPTQQEAGNPK